MIRAGAEVGELEFPATGGEIGGGGEIGDGEFFVMETAAGEGEGAIEGLW